MCKNTIVLLGILRGMWCHFEPVLGIFALYTRIFIYHRLLFCLYFFLICIWILFLFAVWRPQVRRQYKYERLKNGVNVKIRQTEFSIWYLIFSHAVLTYGFVKSIKTDNAKWKQVQHVEIFNVQHFLLLVFIALIENLQSAI